MTAIENNLNSFSICWFLSYVCLNSAKTISQKNACQNSQFFVFQATLILKSPHDWGVLFLASARGNRDASAMFLN